MQNDYSLQFNKNEELYQKTKQTFEPKSSKLNSLHLRPNLHNSFKRPPFVEHQSYLNTDFDFQHVSKYELETILKRFKREKKKQQDLDNWNCFMKSKHEKGDEEMIVKKSESSISENEITYCEECGMLTATESFIGSKTKEERLDMPSNFLEKSLSSPMFRNSTIDINQSHNYQLGPGLTKRLQDLLGTVRKMTSVLLSPCLGTQHEDEDVDRTIKRSLEFDAMFTRNHLYDIQRLLKDIKQTAVKAVTSAELENKISAILKSVAQALQVYTRHISKGSRVKYQQVVPIFQCITTMLSILENLSGQRLFPMRQELEVSCSYLKQVLLEISATETKSVTTVSHKAPKIRLRHKPSSDLSMYSRRQREWRRKTASLARAKFGPPRSKKHCKKSESATPKDACGVLNKNVSSVRDFEDSSTNSKVTTVQCKDLPFRNATRGVHEDQVTTMVETIPQEEQLLATTLTLQEENVMSLTPQEVNVINRKESAREVNNVQLVCVREKSDTKKLLSTKGNKECEQSAEIKSKTLTVDNNIKAELLEYQQNITAYQDSNPLYKDEKALGIIDRLASRFLKEMLIDFQQNEMDQVIRTLYNLEFE